MAEKFLVWNTEARLPTFAHDTHEAAVKEAERLAGLNPGQHFHVMAPIGTAHVPTVYRKNNQWYDEWNNGLPF